MGKVEWSKVLDGVDEALKFFQSEGVKPTLRTLFYNLYSRALLPNTKSAYQSLSKHLVEARKAGRYPWNVFEDKTRVVIGSVEDSRFDDDALETYERRLEDKLSRLDFDAMIEEFFSGLRPYMGVEDWADQPCVVEIWIEKEALSSTVQEWTSSLNVPIRVNRGYSSWTFIYNNCEDLKFTLEKHSKVVILYMGDLDPSGMDIQRFLVETLEYFGIEASRVELRRVGVTPEQVELYKLPERPEDAETLAKLERDPRMKSYVEKFIVELDALVAYVPKEFRTELEETIKEYWDEELRDKLEARSEELKLNAKEMLADYIARAKEKMASA